MNLVDDEAVLRKIAADFADQLTESLPGWIDRIVRQRIREAGLRVDDQAERLIAECATDTSAVLGPKVRAVVLADVDLAAGSPLATIRDGVAPVNEMLTEIGVGPSVRDRAASEMFPDDIHDLGPASFAEIHPELQDGGIAWGAARAYVHLQRHATPLGSESVSDRPSFDQILAAVAEVEGWMTDDQARLLHDVASGLHPGDCMVEIGSFRGRSIIVVAQSAASSVRIVAIDPHGGGDRGPQEIAPDEVRGDADHEAFMTNLASAGVADHVEHVRKTSDDALVDVQGDVDMLYIDGAHRFGPARSDITAWGDRVGVGGTMLIHDSFSSIGVTFALVTTTFLSRRWKYVGRAQSMAEFRHVDLGTAESVKNLMRQLAQLPWFVRNVVIKVLITVKLAPLARLLGHHGTDWPY